MTDEIRDGVYFDKQQPRLLVKLIDGTITVGSQLSLFRFGLGLIVWRNVPPPDDDEEWFDLDAANAADRDRLSKRANELQWAFAKYMLVGSPSGWFFIAFFFPWALAMALWTTLRRQLAVSDVFRRAKWHVRDEVPETERALAFFEHHGEPQPLSRFAS